VRGKREEQGCLRGEHGVCGEWELARFLHVKSTRAAAHTQLGEKLKFVKKFISNI